MIKKSMNTGLMCLCKTTRTNRKAVQMTDLTTNVTTTFKFKSKRELIIHLKISYDVLNYRLKHGTIYDNKIFSEVS